MPAADAGAFEHSQQNGAPRPGVSSTLSWMRLAQVEALLGLSMGRWPPCHLLSGYGPQSASDLPAGGSVLAVGWRPLLQHRPVCEVGFFGAMQTVRRFSLDVGTACMVSNFALMDALHAYK